MAEKTVFRDEIRYTQVLDPEGRLDTDALQIELDLDEIVELYKRMVLARKVDEKALNLQRQGRLGTYAEYKGQEAAQIGSASALESSDLIVPSYREGALLLARGVPLSNIFLYWSGDQRGNYGLKSLNILPPSIPVGSHPVHAVGAIRALNIRGDDGAFAVTYFGDGATSEGDLMEAMNFAGVWNTPVLFFCQNNQWAISLPRHKQSASKTLAQKALAFGFQGEQVDGNDLLAVRQAVVHAREHAIENQKPYLIEAITYRRGDHTTADDASRYRSSQEVEQWKQKDPLTRIRNYLETKHHWSDKHQSEWLSECDEVISEAIESYETREPADPADIFQYTYKELTPALQEQQKELIRELHDE